MERIAKRYSIALPVKLSGGAGLTRDISTSGIFFETPKVHLVGERVIFSTDVAGATIRYEGSVVRVERIAGVFGVAVALTSYRFD